MGTLAAANASFVFASMLLEASQLSFANIPTGFLMTLNHHIDTTRVGASFPTTVSSTSEHLVSPLFVTFSFDFV